MDEYITISIFCLSCYLKQTNKKGTGMTEEVRASLSLAADARYLIWICYKQ